jgi:hypothetical protein
MMGSDKRQRIETRIDCEGEDDAWIDALAKKHSSQIPPPPPPPLPKPPLPGWDAAVARMYESEDTKPLAAMVHSPELMPDWVRNQLAHLLNPKGGYSVGPDRLVFTRSGRTKAKIASQADRFFAGEAVQGGMKEALKYKDAVKRAAGKKAERKKGYSFRYEEKASAD